MVVRRLWLVVGSVLAVGVISFGSLNVVSLLGRDSRSSSTEVSAEGIRLLRVDNENGWVRIQGGDVDTIEVHAEIGDGMRRTRYSTRRDDDTFVVHGECPFFLPTWCDVQLVITVPRALPVRIDADDGRVTARHLDGPLSIDANNGRVLLEDLGGDVDVDHDNGRLFATDLRSDVVEVGGTNGRIALGFTEAPTTVRARTVNGHIDITLPDDQQTYRVEAHTTNGTERTAVRTDPASSRSIDARTIAGDITTHYPDSG